ncbi:hypothetical protein ACWEQP_27650 [Streptomyces sp. NPDC004044]
MPFRCETWRHVLYALFLPLGFALVFALQYVMRAAQDHGLQQVGPLILVAALGAVAVFGPAFERFRVRLFFGEAVGRHNEGRLRAGAVFFVVFLVLSTLSFAAAAGWIIVSVRNLTYPLWGWAPYPDPAWGGPSPIGAVSLHFAAGVVAFFGLPWVIVRLTCWQLLAVRRWIGSGR